MLRISTLQSQEVQRSLDALRKRYGKYAVSTDKLRSILDEELGDKRLTAGLYKMREEG